MALCAASDLQYRFLCLSTIPVHVVFLNVKIPALLFRPSQKYTKFSFASWPDPFIISRWRWTVLSANFASLHTLTQSRCCIPKTITSASSKACLRNRVKRKRQGRLLDAQISRSKCNALRDVASTVPRPGTLCLLRRYARVLVHQRPAHQSHFNHLDECTRCSVNDPS